MALGAAYNGLFLVYVALFGASVAAFVHGLITPACILSGVLILRRATAGYLIAFPLLVLVSFLAPMMAAQTAMQLDAGVTFTTGQIVGIIGSFAAISLLGLWAAVAVLRRLPAEPRPARAVRDARVAPV
jgi:hypothetical protein